MIGRLPRTLEVNGIEYDIRTDYRDCLVIIQAFSDANLSDFEKVCILVQCMYYDYENLLNDENIQEACNKAVWFLNCGDSVSKPKSSKPLYDFEQDEQIIFSAINKIAGKEIRNIDYMHFWTFLGLFNEIGEGTFSTIVGIREKKNHGKKLEKWEKEFYTKNKEMVDLKCKYTKSELDDLSALNEILGIS